MQVQTALFFESPEQIYARVYREIRPRSAPAEVSVEYCPFANANSFIRWETGRIEVRMSDVFQGAPAPIVEALAWILISKLFRKQAPRVYSHRYRLYLNRREVRRHLHLVRQERGRKYVSGPAGEHFHLDAIFDELNFEFFHGLMAKPVLGWSRRPSRTLLGHYDPSHNAIILSKILDRTGVAPLAVRYVLFHEMLHLRYPVEHKGARRCVHTPEFKAAERLFPGWKEAKELLKKL
ncbi:MAG TPA: hypothetical protein DEH78_11020 [Solibacterales bacterium]|nr:hypothetical protein [Bryobacterales bacterium]